MPFLDLSGRGAEVRDEIAAAVGRGGHGQRVSVIAVTKTHPVEAVAAAVAVGFPDIGENKVQEALTKQAQFQAEGVRWHLIGHLQRNKVKHLRTFHLFHALDSSRLADAIQGEYGNTAREGEAGAPGGRVKVLVQVNVAGEETKGGFGLDEMEREAERLMSMGSMEVCGVMTMAPLDANESALRSVFSGARRAREILVSAGHNAVELSMGMSQDFVVAVEEGATMVRLGTALFGERST